jgi:uncharacterized membrane protein
MNWADVIWLDIGFGCFLVFLCLPLFLGLVPPNRWYGIRVPAAYDSRENWYKVNRFGSVVLLACGAMFCFVGALPVLLHWHPTDQGELLLVVLPLVLLYIAAIFVTVLCSLKFSHKPR